MDITGKLQEVELLLKDEIKRKKIIQRYSSAIFHLWEDFLQSQDFNKLVKNYSSGWAAALYYILVNHIMEEKESQKESAHLFEISSSTLSKRYGEIKKNVNINNYKIKADMLAEDNEKKDEKISYLKVRKKAIQEKRKFTFYPLTDEIMIEVFEMMKKIVSLIHPDKDFFEIKRFLQFVELNLVLSGYQVSQKYLENKFGQLFPELDIVPVKGRQFRKFVHLNDKKGNSKPYVLIKLKG